MSSFAAAQFSIALLEPYVLHFIYLFACFFFWSARFDSHMNGAIKCYCFVVVGKFAFAAFTVIALSL